MIPTDKITRKTPISLLRVSDNCLSVGTVRRRGRTAWMPQNHTPPPLGPTASTRQHLSIHNRALPQSPESASRMALILSALVQGHAEIPVEREDVPNAPLLFCGGHCPRRLPVPRGPRTPQKVYIPERRFVLPFVLFRSSHFLTSTRTIP